MKAIVLVAHGWNVSWLGPYGNEWVQTSALDRLSAEGVVFDNHIADLPDPGRAWASLWSGRYQLPAVTGDTEPPTSELPLAGLPDRGIRTVWVRDLRTPLEGELEEVWDTVVTPREAAPEERPIALIEAVETAVQDLAGEKDWLLWVETDRLLPPWQANEDVFAAYAEAYGPLLEDEDTPEPEESDTPIEAYERPPDGAGPPLPYPDWLRLQSSFAAVTSQFDTELEELFDRLRKAGLDQDALWVVTSTSGYPLAEHGATGLSNPHLFEERTHVPLLVRLPAGKEGGRRVATLTQSVDLLPTLLDWFIQEIPPTVHGRSLLATMKGAGRSERAYAVSGLAEEGRREWALRTPDWVLRLPVGSAWEAPRPQLFGKPDDRWEVNDLYLRDMEWADHLAERLRTFVAAAAHPGALEVPPLKLYDDFKKTLEPAAPTGGPEGGS